MCFVFLALFPSRDMRTLKPRRLEPPSSTDRFGGAGAGAGAGSRPALALAHGHEPVWVRRNRQQHAA